MGPIPGRSLARMNSKASTLILLFILAVAAVIRVYFALRCTAVPGYSDMALYNAAALKGGFPTSLPPGYPLFLRAIYALFGTRNYTAVFVVQGLISALTVLLIYRVTSSVASRRAGLLAAAIAAVYPNLIVYNLTTLTDTIGVFFAMILFFILVVAIPERTRSVLAAFVVFLGFTFRPVMVLFAPGVFLSIKKRWTFAVAAVVLLTPLIAFEMTVGKSFQRSAIAVYETYHPSLDGSQFINPDSTELRSDTLSSAVYLKAALANIAHNRWKAIDNIYYKVTVLFSRGWDTFVLEPIVGTGTLAYYVWAYAYLPVLVFGFIGMARLYGRGNRMLALPALSYAVLVVLFFLFKFRYRLPIEPVLIIYASMLLAGGRSRAAGFDEAAARTGTSAAPRWGGNRGIIAAIVLLALALRVYFAFACRTPVDSIEMETYNRLALKGGLGSAAAPLYPLFLRAIYSLCGAGNYTALFLAQGILSALAVVLLYAAVARLCGGTVGVIAAAICAVFPDFIRYNLKVGVESLSVFLVAALMAASTARIGARLRTLLVGVLVALGVLIEPLLVCLAPGALLASRRRTLLLLVMMLALVPFVVINTIRTQKIEPVYEVRAFGLGLGNFTGPGSLEHAIDAVYGNARSVMTKGWRLPDATARSERQRGSINAAVYSYAIVMLMGFVGLARYYRREHGAFALPVLLYIVLLVLFSYFRVRYRAPLEPVLVAYAALLLGGGCRAPAASQGES